MLKDTSEVRYALRKATCQLTVRDVALSAFDDDSASAIDRASRALKSLIADRHVERVHGPNGLHYVLVGRDLPQSTVLAALLESPQQSVSTSGEARGAEAAQEACAVVVDPAMLPVELQRSSYASHMLRILAGVQAAGGTMRSRDVGKLVPALGPKVLKYVTLQMRMYGVTVAIGTGAGAYTRLASEQEAAAAIAKVRSLTAMSVSGGVTIVAAPESESSVNVAGDDAGADPNAGPNAEAAPIAEVANADDVQAEVLEILERNVTCSQDALDAYLMSVADPKVVAPLVAARNHSKHALQAWQSRGVAP